MSTYTEDLKFLHDKLIQHPLFVLQPSERSRFENMYDRLVSKQNSFSDFIDAMTILTGFFHDGHTNIELPYSADDRCLNIPCYWQENRLLLSQNNKDVPRDSQILSIEQTSVDDIISRMANRIPHENNYLVKSRMIHYPYKNYHVFSELNLTSLFGNKRSFEICFSLGGQQIIRQFHFENYNGFLDFKEDDEFVSYEFDGKTAILHLNACIYNDRYTSALDALADLCLQKGITTLILDLSQNMGGSSAVIDEFIRHVDMDEFRRYEMIDYTEGCPKIITSRKELIRNEKSDKRFPPKIICRVSHNTFSSARTFAVTLKDNGIAAITGCPSGGKPSSFGLPKKYKTPNHAIAFRVSSCLFLRPDPSGDQDISLFPDI